MIYKGFLKNILYICNSFQAPLMKKHGKDEQERKGGMS